MSREKSILVLARSAIVLTVSVAPNAGWAQDGARIAKAIIEQRSSSAVPEIDELSPKGGVEGNILTVVGRNFGTAKEDITILFDVETQDKKETSEKPKAIVLSVTLPDANRNGEQRLRFEIPSGALDDHWLVNRTKITITVKSKSSVAIPLSVLNPHWRLKCELISLGVVLAVLIPVFVSFRHLPGVREKWNAIFFVLFLNKKTNKYSLSKFQAFGWTVVLLGSYFYLAFGKGLIFGFTTIPDFNPSLIVLMAISIGGLVSSQGVERKNPRNDLEGSPRNLTNLFTEGGDVSLPRLQLFGFTIVAWVIFLCYMTSADVFTTGMPDLPANLLGLIGISQGGYIGGKMARGALAVNLIVPRRIGVKNKKPIKLTLNGSGFVNRTKVLFGNENELKEVTFENENVVSIDNVLQKETPGWNQLIIVPPVGRSILIDKAVEFVDAKFLNVKVSASDKKRLQLRLGGFLLEDTVCTIGGNATERVEVEEKTGTVTFAAEAEIQSGEEIKVTSEDNYLVATETTP